MVCPQCNGTTLQGTACRMKTCKYAPKCHHHTKVKVATSNIQGAGKGLFASKDIHKGEMIGNYRVGTKELTRAQFLSKYPSGKATHVWAPSNKGPYYDSSNLSKSVAGAVNRSNKPNVRINGNGKLVARDKIPAGRELTTSYGRGYVL